MSGFEAPEYMGQTSLHVLAALGLLILAILAMTVRTRLILMPLVVAATTLPMSQRIVIADVDLTLMRILLLVCLIRVLTRGEHKDLTWGTVDKALLLWPIAGTVMTLIHYGSTEQFVNRAGWTYDILLTYFIGRCAIRSIEDILSLARTMAVISVPIALAFFVERVTQHNPFSVFGGVPEVTVIREGRLRCQGPFAHPILAGTFWASTLPLLWTLWKGDSKARILCATGSAATLFIIFACSSSTPLLSTLVAMMGLALFRFRHLRTQMWVGFFLTLLVLHIVMKAPVWHLMARVDLVGGSTGWHRYRILDAFINNFSKWWATGDHNPMSWGVWEMRDITNQFILEGLRGGLMTLLAFVLILVYSFRAVGRALRHLQGRGNASAEWGIWMIGTIILVHTTTFFGASYFGQMTAILYIHLALAGAVMTQLVPATLASGVDDDKTPQASAAGRGKRSPLLSGGKIRPRKLAASTPSGQQHAG